MHEMKTARDCKVSRVRFFVKVYSTKRKCRMAMVVVANSHGGLCVYGHSGRLLHTSYNSRWKCWTWMLLCPRFRVWACNLLRNREGKLETMDSPMLHAINDHIVMIACMSCTVIVPRLSCDLNCMAIEIWRIRNTKV